MPALVDPAGARDGLRPLAILTDAGTALTAASPRLKPYLQ